MGKTPPSHCPPAPTCSPGRSWGAGLTEERPEAGMMGCCPLRKLASGFCGALRGEFPGEMIKIESRKGVPVMPQRKQIQLETMRLQVQSLAKDEESWQGRGVLEAQEFLEVERECPWHLAGPRLCGQVQTDSPPSRPCCTSPGSILPPAVLLISSGLVPFLFTHFFGTFSS